MGILNIEHERLALDTAGAIDGLDRQRHALFEAMPGGRQFAGVGQECSETDARLLRNLFRSQAADGRRQQR